MYEKRGTAGLARPHCPSHGNFMRYDEYTGEYRCHCGFVQEEVDPEIENVHRNIDFALEVVKTWP